MTDKALTSFWKMNRHKLGFMLKVLIAIFLVFGLLLTFIPWYLDGFFEVDMAIGLLLIFGLGFPAFILLLGYLNWFTSRRIQNRTFRLHPLNRLKEIGFSKGFMNYHSKWQFTEEIKAGCVNDFIVSCIVTRDNPNDVLFQATVKLRRIQKPEFKRLDKLLEKENMAFGYNSLVKKYPVKTLKTLSIEQLQHELVQFTMRLKELRFEPDTKVAEWPVSQ